MATDTALPPGGTIGVLGGGQLGRMLALAAARLGYRCHIYCPEPDGPAAQVSAANTVAAYDDADALDRFAAAIDVVTVEFENIPVAALERIAAKVPARPSPQVLATCQDRLLEKDFVTGRGVATTPYAAIAGIDDLRRAMAAIGPRAVLKTARMGYDGKGQQALAADSDLDAAFAALAGAPAILEAWCDLALEVSVIVARGTDSAMVAYPAVENRHVNHILDTTIAPAPIQAAQAAEAEAIARKLAEGLDLVGLLAVEMFVTRDGALRVNELAPRPHNSGHWTLDACLTSQFEQCARAVAGLPLGAVDRHADAVMRNLIGDAAADWAGILTDPRAKLHLYGKAEARPGRKMGHVTWLKPRSPRRD
jgi:5-(carboxyamino)imidazole ribonucleotide synthase